MIVVLVVVVVERGTVEAVLGEVQSQRCVCGRGW